MKDLDYYLEMALKNKYKEQMDDFNSNPPIKAPITNTETAKKIENFIKSEIDDDKGVRVRIVKRDKSKTFDSFYEIDITPIYKNTGDNAVLFKKIVADIKSYLQNANISKHAYEIFVKNVGFLK